MKQDHEGVVSDLSEPGVCLAKAQLYNTLEPSGTTITIDSGDLPIIYHMLNLPPKPEAGFSLGCSVLEFDVAGLGELKLWTSASHDTQFVDYGALLEDDANPIGGAKHIRGTWAQAHLKLEFPVAFDAKSVYQEMPPLYLRQWDQEVCGCVGGDIQNCPVPGPDRSYFRAVNSFEPSDATDNKGAYGANLSYRFYVKNTESPLGFISTFLVARNTGSKFWGAARLTLPTLGVGMGISKVPITSLDTPPEELRQVYLNSPLAHSNKIPILGNTGPQPIEVELTTGGGAALPINFRIEKAIILPASGDGE